MLVLIVFPDAAFQPRSGAHPQAEMPFIEPAEHTQVINLTPPQLCHSEPRSGEETAAPRLEDN